MPDSTLGVVLRIAAFALVCIAAALTPGPVDPSLPHGPGRSAPAPSAP
jgi:hypothetical protein